MYQKNGFLLILVTRGCNCFKICAFYRRSSMGIEESSKNNMIFQQNWKWSS